MLIVTLIPDELILRTVQWLDFRSVVHLKESCKYLYLMKAMEIPFQKSYCVRNVVSTRQWFTKDSLRHRYQDMYRFRSQFVGCDGAARRIIARKMDCTKWVVPIRYHMSDEEMTVMRDWKETPRRLRTKPKPKQNCINEAYKLVSEWAEEIQDKYFALTPMLPKHNLLGMHCDLDQCAWVYSFVSWKHMHAMREVQKKYEREGDVQFDFGTNEMKMGSSWARAYGFCELEMEVIHLAR